MSCEKRLTLIYLQYKFLKSYRVKAQARERFIRQRQWNQCRQKRFHGKKIYVCTYIKQEGYLILIKRDNSYESLQAE